jgi:hypothetical protein
MRIGTFASNPAYREVSTALIAGLQMDSVANEGLNRGSARHENSEKTYAWRSTSAIYERRLSELG